jgi:hypothetical protein
MPVPSQQNQNQHRLELLAAVDFRDLDHLDLIDLRADG